MALMIEPNLEGERLRDLEFGALLHDVGKIAVPKEIINKAGRLTPDEWTIIQRHTIDRQRMLENVGGVLSRVGVIVRASHESYDGSGYPDLSPSFAAARAPSSTPMSSPSS